MKQRISLSGLIAAFCIICASGAFLGTLPGLPFPFTLFSHFKHFYGPFLLLFGLVLYALKKPKHAAFCAVLGIWNLGIIGLDIMGSKPKAAEGPRLKLVLANVFTGSRQHESLEDWLLTQNADIILLLEVNEEWWESLERIRPRYPYGRRALRSDNFGIALLSRLPLKEASLISLGQESIPSISAELQFNSKPLSIIAIHPPPPVTRRYVNSRDIQFKQTAHLAQNKMENGEVILIGDLNVTPWSTPFKRLLRNSGLIDSRKGFGLQATWPQVLPLFLPLDHVFLSPGLATIERILSDSHDSDHRPITITIGPAIREPS